MYIFIKNQTFFYLFGHVFRKWDENIYFKMKVYKNLHFSCLEIWKICDKMGLIKKTRRKKMNPIKIMVVETEEECKKYTREFKEVDYMDVIATSIDGENAVMKAAQTNPDVVILDILLPVQDGFELFTKIKNECPKTKIIAVSALNSSFYVNKALKMGFDYFMIKPIETYVIARRIMELFDNEGQDIMPIERKIEEKITNIFLTVGIPAHIKGYQFLREAIKLTISDPLIINNITKRLYPSIASIYSTSASKVERAIRHAIEVAWNKGKIENINDVFGLKVYDTHEKPTNGEFIALVADKMIIEGCN